MEKIRKLIHPLLLSLYPVLMLLYINIEDVAISTSLRSLVASVLLTSILLALYIFIFRDYSKAGIAASVSVVLFFSYGHLYDSLKEWGLSGTYLVRHRFLLPTFSVLFIICLLLIKLSKQMDLWVRFANIVATVALILVLGQIGHTLIIRTSTSTVEESPEECLLQTSPQQDLPDIYFIVMDAYERSDILLEMHGFDNQPFIQSLEVLGFQIPTDSISNYRFTVLSMASMLNMDYIQAFPDRYDPESQNRWGIATMIEDNRVRRELECIGYSTATISSGVYWTDWPSADYYYSLDGDPFHAKGLLNRISRFEALFLETTGIRFFLDGFRQMGLNSMPEGMGLNEVHRARIEFQLNTLPDLTGLTSPKLIYAHILAPHPPFVFGKDTSLQVSENFEEQFAADSKELRLLEDYAIQIEFLNGQILGIVEEILKRSEEPPVIIITADHGWADRTPADKLAIFQAYYFPESSRPDIYPSISAVNAFRITFDTIFGTQLGLLPDIGYYSTLEDIWDFEIVRAKETP